MKNYEKVLQKLLKEAGEYKILIKDDIEKLVDPKDEDYITLINELEDHEIEIYEDEDEYNAVIAEQLELISIMEEEEPDEESLAEIEKEELDDDFFDDILTDNTIRLDDPVRLYLKEIGQFDLIDGPEELRLGEKISIGKEARIELAHMRKEGTLTPEYEEQFMQVIEEGNRAKNKLIQANYRLVVHIAKQFNHGALDFLDLIQEGNIGLMVAADRFDYTKRNKFSTYATWWVKQRISRAIDNQSRTVRIPVHMNESISKLSKVKRRLKEELGREPLDEEIAVEMDIDPKKVQTIKRAAMEPLSLETPVGEEAESSLADFIPDPNAETPEDHMMEEALVKALDEALERLTDREEKVLRMRHGLLDGKNYTLEEVGKEFGVTRERIRQIESKALRKLRSYGSDKKLKEVYYSKGGK